MKGIYRSICLLSFAVMVALSAAAQKGPADYFDEGEKAFEEKRYDKALTAFQHIMSEHARNPISPQAFYNTGIVYYRQKQIPQAIAVFKQVLQSSLDDRAPSGYRSLMADPYANYKHNASDLLSTICEKQQRYREALAYLYMADTLYHYQHFCGNEQAGNSVYLALRYATIYQKLHRPDSAISALLPVVFKGSVTNITPALSRLKLLLKGRYSKGVLKAQLDEALSAMYSKTITPLRGTDYQAFYFRFLNNELAAPYYYNHDGETLEETIKAAKSSAFYQMIAEL